VPIRLVQRCLLEDRCQVQPNLAEIGKGLAGIWALNLLFEPVYQNYATCQTLISFSRSDCQHQFQTQLADAQQRKLTAVAMVGLGPIPVAWLLVYALVGIVRWIKRGFQPST
jgi:hypothetical protein